MKAKQLVSSSCPAFLCLWLASLSHAAQLFSAINGSLCINSNFIVTIRGQSGDIVCASLCSDNQKCQAFTTADGPCQLFVFDKCSKSVRDCSCSRRGQVFVKQQSGLQPGALCPSNYTDPLCGVKYKLYEPAAVWKQQLNKCQSESGLVIMSDVNDAAEMNQINMFRTKYSVDFYLGGFQAPNSTEPASGWYWVECNNVPFNASFWASIEPNDNPHDENAVVNGLGAGLWEISEINLRGVLCECVSPFD